MDEKKNFLLGKKRKIIITVLCLIGLGLTIELLRIFLNVNFEALAEKSFCSVNSFIDCDGVAKTPFAVFLGIPLAIWGLLFYLLILFFVFVDKLQTKKFLGFLQVFKSPRSYIAILGLIAFSVSMLLACISITQIGKICVLCFATYFIDLAIACTASTWKYFIITDLKNSVVDFFMAIKQPKYLVSFLAVLVVASTIIFYFDESAILAPRLRAAKSMEEFFFLEGNPYNIHGNVLGDKNGKVKIEVYTDYRCGFCRVESLMLEKLVYEYNNIEVIHYNTPLDNTCNKNIGFEGHHNSCMLAKYVIAAGEQNKYWDMSIAIFDKFAENEKQVMQIADTLKLDKEKLKKDFNSKKVDDILQQQLARSADINLNATPTMVIDGEVYVGTKPYYELEKIVKAAGAVKKPLNVKYELKKFKQRIKRRIERHKHAGK